MQGKMKSFFEDVGIIFVLSVSIFIGYYVYTTFYADKSENIEVQEKVVISDQNLSIDDNATIEIKEHNESNISTIITTEKVIPKIEKEIKSVEVKIKEKETPVSVTVSKPKIVKETKIEIEKVKNVDVVMLRSFLRKVKFDIASNIVKRNDINATQSQELKIRITVLKDGSYEDLKFIDGDKQLFEMNQSNIVRVFPLKIDEKIQDEFPRYIRISIK